MEISLFWKINLGISFLVQPLVWRYCRMRWRVKPLTPLEFIKVVGGSFVPFLNLGMLRKYMEPKDRLYQLSGLIIECCDELDQWLHEQDENGTLLMAKMVPPAKVYFLVNQKKLEKMRYAEVRHEFWKYMGLYCQHLGYEEGFYAWTDGNAYLEIRLGG